MSDIQEEQKRLYKKAEENDIKEIQRQNGMTLGEEQQLYWEDFKNPNYDDLLKENAKLKELCDKYEEEHNTKFNEWVFDKRENERLNLIIRAIKIQCEVWEDYEMSEFIRQLENEKEISTWLKRVAGVDKE